MRKCLVLPVMLLLVCTLFACAQPVAEQPVVWYLNDDPSAETAWKALAEIYTQKTGIPVEIETVSGDYAAVLAQRLEEENAPTVFSYHPDAEQACLDLTDTGLLRLLPAGVTANKHFPYAFQKSWGILVNKALLQAAGFRPEDIHHFLSLREVTQSIHNRRNTLGFDAFSPPNMEDLSTPISLLKDYPDSLRRLWELCSRNCAVAVEELSSVTSQMSLDAFGKGQAVFYIQCSDVYSQLIEQYNMSPEDLLLIPMYTGNSEIILPACGQWRSWGIHAGATEVQQQAAIDFLNWVATSQAGTSVISQQYGGSLLSPAAEASNPLLSQAAVRLRSGEMAPLWNEPDGIARLPVLYEALLAYAQRNLEWESIQAFLKN